MYPSSARRLTQALPFVFALIVWLVSSPAQAEPAPGVEARVRTCVVVLGAGDRAGLSALVRSEVDRHPSHRVVSDGCAAHLRVERIVVDKQAFLTGRINAQVPHRVPVANGTGKALESAVIELLRVLLHNDPVLLKGPSNQSWTGRTFTQLKDQGLTLFSAELYQSFMLLGNRLSTSPGVALRVRREIDAWELGVQVSANTESTLHVEGLRLDADVKLAAALSHFSSTRAATALYVTALAGVQHQRFYGPSDFGSSESFQITGVFAGIRGGVEFLRTHTIRGNVFLQANFPVFLAKDKEQGVISQWTPSLSLGAGIAF